MQIWPAIDLRAGKCVRLMQGDYDRETVYDDDPAAVARRWAEAVVDLWRIGGPEVQPLVRRMEALRE